MSSPVSGFPLAGNVELNDLLHIVQDAGDRRISVGNLASALGDSQVITNSDGTAIRFASGIQIASHGESELWSSAISRFSFGSTQSLNDADYVVRFGSPPDYPAPFDDVFALLIQGGIIVSSDEWLRIGAVSPGDLWAEQSTGLGETINMRWQYIAIGTWSE